MPHHGGRAGQQRQVHDHQPLETTQSRQLRGASTTSHRHSANPTSTLPPLLYAHSPERQVVPTVGFSEEVFEKGNLRFQAVDMSGAGEWVMVKHRALACHDSHVTQCTAGTYRSLWETYYRDSNAVIWVVDSSDKIRMCIAKDELDAMLAHADIKVRPLACATTVMRSLSPTRNPLHRFTSGAGRSHPHPAVRQQDGPAGGAGGRGRVSHAGPGRHPR